MKATIQQLEKRHNNIINVLLCRPLDEHETTLLRYYSTKIKEYKKNCCKFCNEPIKKDNLTPNFCNIICKFDYFGE